jgi:hypothetical protein
MGGLMRNRLPEAVQIARSLRRSLMRQYRTSTYQCVRWSGLLIRALADKGIRARELEVYVNQDGYKRVSGRIVWDKENGDAWIYHSVVVVGWHIIDITADQFNGMMRPGHRFPAVVFGKLGRGLLRNHHKVI